MGVGVVIAVADLVDVELIGGVVQAGEVEGQVAGVGLGGGGDVVLLVVHGFGGVGDGEVPGVGSNDVAGGLAADSLRRGRGFGGRWGRAEVEELRRRSMAGLGMSS